VEGGKLLAESKVLESELGTGAEGGAKAGEQVQKQGEHGWVAHDAIARLPFLWIHALTDGKRGLWMKMWRRTTAAARSSATSATSKRR